jgi:LacI family transcriptional regulator
MEHEERMLYVDVDNRAGGALATEHLIKLGHHRIAYVGKPSLTSSQDRREGYRAALEQHGIPLDESLITVAEGSSERHGYEATQRLLKAERLPSAIFLANDLMAIGALKALTECGKRVPQDVSLVGFDDVPMGEYVAPPLTTVHQPAFEKGVRATELLIQCLEGDEPPRSETLPVKLVVRKSTARLWPAR